jgi:hypothetical protein
MSDIIIDVAPVGSIETIITPTFGPIVVGDSNLNGLENGQQSSEMIFANEGNAEFVTIIILVNPISPIANGTIQIINKTQGYELHLSPTNNVARQLRFVNVPASFTTSFVVKNCSGVPLAAFGNHVIVSPQYQL